MDKARLYNQLSPVRQSGHEARGHGAAAQRQGDFRHTGARGAGGSQRTLPCSEGCRSGTCACLADSQCCNSAMILHAALFLPSTCLQYRAVVSRFPAVSFLSCNARLDYRNTTLYDPDRLHLRPGDHARRLRCCCGSAALVLRSRLPGRPYRTGCPLPPLVAWPTLPPPRRRRVQSPIWLHGALDGRHAELHAPAARGGLSARTYAAPAPPMCNIFSNKLTPSVLCWHLLVAGCVFSQQNSHGKL